MIDSQRKSTAAVCLDNGPLIGMNIAATEAIDRLLGDRRHRSPATSFNNVSLAIISPITKLTPQAKG